MEWPWFKKKKKKKVTHSGLNRKILWALFPSIKFLHRQIRAANPSSGQGWVAYTAVPWSMLNTQSTKKLASRIYTHKLQVKVWITHIMIHVQFKTHNTLYFKKTKQKVIRNEPWRQKLESDFLAVSKACKAIFWPTQCLTRRTFDSSGLQAKGTLIISMSVLPTHLQSAPNKREWQG